MRIYLYLQVFLYCEILVSLLPIFKKSCSLKKIKKNKIIKYRYSKINWRKI